LQENMQRTHLYVVLSARVESKFIRRSGPASTVPGEQSTAVTVTKVHNVDSPELLTFAPVVSPEILSNWAFD
ncbi:MAG: hypothetical protein PVH24_06630, partial [Candidatus Zixiibacteriota bacterium]